MEDRTVAADGGVYSKWAKSLAAQSIVTLAALAQARPDAATTQQAIPPDTRTRWAWESLQESLSRIVESEKRRAT